jgi:hypothetical protein
VNVEGVQRQPAKRFEIGALGVQLRSMGCVRMSA